jgi:hypothetical protein
MFFSFLMNLFCLINRANKTSVSFLLSIFLFNWIDLVDQFEVPWGRLIQDLWAARTKLNIQLKKKWAPTNGRGTLIKHIPKTADYKWIRSYGFQFSRFQILPPPPTPPNWCCVEQQYFFQNHFLSTSSKKSFFVPVYCHLCLQKQKKKKRV